MGQIQPLTVFTFEGVDQPVEFIETLQVTDGVECDVYRFISDQTKDLGIIKIQPGCKTPLQKVLQGDRTVEGYIRGKGKLTITKANGDKVVRSTAEDLQGPIKEDVGIDELMQWEADPDSELVAYEICFPPYEEGRYENL